MKESFKINDRWAVRLPSMTTSSSFLQSRCLPTPGITLPPPNVTRSMQRSSKCSPRLCHTLTHPSIFRNLSLNITVCHSCLFQRRCSLLLSSHCWLLCSLSCSEMGSMEAVSHSLIRYPCIVPSHNTLLDTLWRSPAILQSRHPEVTVLLFHCDLWTSAPGSVLDISCCLEFLFPFGDCPRAYT